MRNIMLTGYKFLKTLFVQKYRVNLSTVNVNHLEKKMLPCLKI